MSLALMLEDFAQPPAPPPDATPDDAQLEAFERGYQAGWDDAASSIGNQQEAIRAEISQSMQEAGFTFYEAQAAVINNIEPVLEAVLHKLLPNFAQAALAPLVAEKIATILRTHGAGEISVAAPADQVEALNAALLSCVNFPVTVRADDTLQPNQATLSVAGKEQMLDLNAAIATIIETVLAGLTAPVKEVQKSA